MLTEKQRAYITARKAGKNQRESAIAAGYSEATADQSASRLEKNPDVKRVLSMVEGDVAGFYGDPMDFLMNLMNSDPDVKIQIDAAKALMPYKHAKVGEQGKKEQKAAMAKKAATESKFRPRVVN